MLITRWWPRLQVTDFYFWYWLLGSLFIIGVILLAIVAGAFAFVVRTKRPTWASKARMLASLLGTGLVPVFTVLAIGRFVHGSLPTGSYAERFEERAWKASPAYVAGDITPRQKMLGDVVERRLAGKTRSEIEAMLGPSEETSYFEETGRDLIYVTGPERDTPFSIDNEWLLIWLDERGRFQRCAIYRD